MNRPLPLTQIAMSVTNQKQTYAWYQQAFGFLPAGGTDMFRGPLASWIQGLKKASSRCWWLVDQQQQFQLELFQFKSPQAKPLPQDWRPNDVGYSMMSLWVADFDLCLARLARLGSKLETAVLESPGDRRVCVRDPEGVLIEIMEADLHASKPRPRVNAEAQVAVRSVTLSVPELAEAEDFFRDTLGLAQADGVQLHKPEHEALWGLAGAVRKQSLLWADDILVELVEYTKPLGKPMAKDYKVSDQGLLNIAFGFRRWRDFNAVHQRCKERGVKANSWAVNLGNWCVVYVNNSQNFSVELLMVRSWYDAFMGFKAKLNWNRSPKLDV